MDQELRHLPRLQPRLVRIVALTWFQEKLSAALTFRM